MPILILLQVLKLWLALLIHNAPRKRPLGSAEAIFEFIRELRAVALRAVQMSMGRVGRRGNPALIAALFYGLIVDFAPSFWDTK